MSIEEFKHRGLIPNVTRLRASDSYFEDNFISDTDEIEETRELEFLFLGFGESKLIVASARGVIKLFPAHWLQIIPNQQAKTVAVDLVNEMRDKTGYNIMDCNEALKDANGDLDLAVTNLTCTLVCRLMNKQNNAKSIY